jgi:diguanylate cyclase (GGDEF)-like protein
MEPRRDHAGEHPFRRLIWISSLAVILVAAVVLIGGWILDVRALRTIIPGAVGMKASTAFMLALCGIALLLVAPERQTVGMRWLGRLLAVPAGVLGALVLGEYVFGWSLGIDEWPFIDHDGRAAGVAFPGRCAPTTAVCFVLLTAALLTLDSRSKWRWRPSELLAVPIAIVASMSLIGYAYSISTFYGPGSAAKMAVHTAFCCVALAIAILAARPRGRLLGLATTTDPGGVMLRRLVPIGIAVLLSLGWLHLRTVDSWSVVSLEVGTWWLTAATGAVLGSILLSCAASISRTDRARRELEEHLQELANHDELTGLANRRHFHRELGAFIAYGKRFKHPGALVIIDLDDFKSVNDRRGHVAGDRLLAAVGEALVARVRTIDLVGRLGGDEFGVILHEIDAGAAWNVAAQLVAEIAAVAVDFPGGPVTISASAGVAHVADFADLDVERLLSRADVAMYLSKDEGGNTATSAISSSIASSSG